MGAALATLIMPTAWFIGTCWAFAFYIRLTRELSWRLLIAVGGGVATFTCGCLVFQAKKIGIASSNPKEATWHRVLFWTMLSAWLLGMGFGEMIFQTYTRTYYEVTGLNAYAGVSPGKSSGSQMLDAGVVTFDSGTWLDRARAASFQEGDVYCVSPILPAPEPPYVKDASGKVKLASYDFWAVGKNCCGDQENLDFQCGEYSNPYARSGMRAIVSEKEKALYRKAIQHAEGNFGMQATQPLYFYWMQDPNAEVTYAQDIGYKYFLGVSLTFFGLQLCIVMLTLASLLKDAIV